MQMSGTLGLSNVEQSLMQVEKFKYQKNTETNISLIHFDPLQNQSNFNYSTGYWNHGNKIIHNIISIQKTFQVLIMLHFLQRFAC